MSRRPIDKRSITAGEVLQLLTVSLPHRREALPILTDRLQRMRRKDLDAYASCVSGLLLVLVDTVAEVGEAQGAAPDEVALLQYLALQMAERGWLEDPALFVSTVHADGL